MAKKKTAVRKKTTARRSSAASKPAAKKPASKSSRKKTPAQLLSAAAKLDQDILKLVNERAKLTIDWIESQDDPRQALFSPEISDSPVAAAVEDLPCDPPQEVRASRVLGRTTATATASWRGCSRSLSDQASTS